MQSMLELSSENILDAYRVGRFPMADPESGKIGWYSPEARGILPLDRFHVPRSVRQVMKRFTVTTDRAFEGVIDGCAARVPTWISREVRDAYVELHRKGSAHSVESWAGSELAGGLYGVHIGGAFMAESMFHRRTDASKVALVALVERLRGRGFVLCDIQMVTSHTARFGAIEISRWEYRQRLEAAVALSVTWQ